MNIKKCIMKKFLISSSPLLAILMLSLVTLPRWVLAEGTLSFNVVSRLNSSITSIEGLLVAILNIFIIIATPIIVLFIIYAGFLYVTAQGNPQQIQQASRALTYAIIGGVIVLGSVALAEILANIVSKFRA
jgi:hypothetical protein